MRVRPISDPHKATIKRHLEESLAEGVPLDQIHADLVRVFSQKGKYSLPQITAVTSWLRSEILGKKRVQEVVWDESDGESSEDVDFDNATKNSSRDWHMHNFLRHSTAEQRGAMRMLLLPGQNTYDLDAVTSTLGIPGSHLLTYIRGDQPKANAQYLRNTRRYGVEDARIGDMATGLYAEQKRIRAAYVDFFGQFSPAYVRVFEALPLPADEENILLSINCLKGREHASTQDMLDLAYQGSVHPDTDDLSSGFLKKFDLDYRRESDLVDVRMHSVSEGLFSNAGTGRQENWYQSEAMTDYLGYCLKPLLSRHPYSPEAEPARHLANIGTCLYGLVHNFNEIGKRYGEDLLVPLPYIASAVFNAGINAPWIRKIIGPHEYVSEHKSRPFYSFFAVISTQKKFYEKYREALDFALRLGRLHCEVQESKEKGIAYALEGFGSNKRLKIFEKRSNVCVADIKHEVLLSACFEAMAHVDYSHSCRQDPLDSAHHRQQELENARLNVEMHDRQRLQATPRDVRNPSIDQASTPIPRRPLQKSEHVGRNDTCPCGSGRKFKKCCMRK